MPLNLEYILKSKLQSKLNCKKESLITYKVLKCSRYISEVPSLKLTAAIEMKTGSTLLIWQLAVRLRNWYRVCLAETIHQFIYGLSFLNFLILQMINNPSLIDLTALTLNLLSMTFSRSLAVGSVVLRTMHWGFVVELEWDDLLEFYFYKSIFFFPFSLILSRKKKVYME